jgi:hypothetical protein
MSRSFKSLVIVLLTVVLFASAYFTWRNFFGSPGSPDITDMEKASAADYRNAIYVGKDYFVIHRKGVKREIHGKERWSELTAAIPGLKDTALTLVFGRYTDALNTRGILEQMTIHDIKNYKIVSADAQTP